MDKARHRLWLQCVGLLALALAVPPAVGPVGYRGSGDDRPDPRRLLEQVLHDVLSNPDLERYRVFYGTRGGKRVALVKDSPVAWPKDWQPAIAGYEIQYRSEQEPVEDFVYWYLPAGPRIVSLARSARPRLLAIRLDKCNWEPDRASNDQIALALFNLGGNGGDAPVIGACHVCYTITHRDGRWLIEYAGSSAQ